ncbi:MAG: hypothetical protein J6386_17150 [Candidatus Synoicihabitans palmerolidicus]|nr:hypothetical protein [Candidatus Synoicihabitans palmerolidicus]
MIVHARKQGLRFGWVGFDCLYGSSTRSKTWGGGRFVGDVARTTKVWTQQLQLEKPHAGRGRLAKNYRLSEANPAQYRSVEALAQEHFESAHQRVKYRSGTKGELWTRIWVSTVSGPGSQAHRSHESVY